MVHTNKHTFFLTKNLQIVLVCLSVISVSYFLLIKSPNQMTLKSQSQLTNANKRLVSASTEGQNSKVDFMYFVKDISPELITLTGAKGDLTLSNNTEHVEVFKGPTQASKRMQISELKVGEKVTAEYISDSLIRLYRSSQ